MTVSNDERRKIAEELRGIDTSEDPCNSALLFKGIAEAVGTWATWKGKPPHALPTYEWHVAQNRKLLNRLAGLIEPGPERRYGWEQMPPEERLAVIEDGYRKGREDG